MGGGFGGLRTDPCTALPKWKESGWAVRDSRHTSVLFLYCGRSIIINIDTSRDV